MTYLPFVGTCVHPGFHSDTCCVSFVFCFASPRSVFCAQCFLCLLCPVFPVSFVPSVSGVFGLSPGTSLVNIYSGKNYIALVQLEIRYDPLNKYIDGYGLFQVLFSVNRITSTKTTGFL